MGWKRLTYLKSHGLGSLVSLRSSEFVLAAGAAGRRCVLVLAGKLSLNIRKILNTFYILNLKFENEEDT